MWERFKRQRNMRRVARRVEEARRRGDGLYVNEWTDEAGVPRSASEAIVGWCRETVARCRRPFGIDHFDLVVALRGRESQSPTSRLYRLRAADLYDESVLDKIAAFIFGRPEPVHVAAAIFSWGDATDRALPRD